MDSVNKEELRSEDELEKVDGGAFENIFHFDIFIVNGERYGTCPNCGCQMKVVELLKHINECGLVAK